MTPTSPTNPERRRNAGTALALAVGLGLLIRLVFAFLVQSYVDRKQTLCVFGDTAIYWQLGGQIAQGQTYQVDQMGVPHFALRTPGYPIFLAACRMLFGDRMMPVRLLQAFLNALSLILVASLVNRSLGEQPGGRGLTLGVLAALIAAVDPYAAGMCVLALSEGPFFPLMLLGLAGLATLWPKDPTSSVRHPWLVSVGTGLAWGAAIQTRPSWALFVPLLLLVWVVVVGRARRRQTIVWAGVVALGVALVMAPWWIRNTRIFGRFVPTALWVGASLYDGLSPTANGASDMRFLEAPDIAALDEQAQDAELKQRSIAFVRSAPGRAIWLGLVKAGRYFSPWPNADTLRSPLAALLSALWTIPIFAFTAIGIWETRRDPRALILLLGPLLYFLILHMVFVSSIRYRIPGFLPAFGLTAVGLRKASSWYWKVNHDAN